MAITTIHGLPVFKAVLGEKGMVCVSLVDSPAVDKDFMAFDADAEPIRYAIESEEKRLVFGVVMRANYPIYREGEQGGYFILHSPELIRAMAEQYLTDGNANNVDTQHNGRLEEGCNLVQFFIKDASKGISPEGFADVENGSLFGEFHITNDEVWDAIKRGDYKGFSIEVFEGIEPVEGIISTEKVNQAILDWLDGYCKQASITQSDMAIIQKMKATLTKVVSVPQTYGSVSTDKGVIAWEGDDELEAGVGVWSLDAEGNRIDLEDGDYRTEDNKVIVVEGKTVKEIRDDAAEVAPQVEAEVEAEGEAPAAEEAPKPEAPDYEPRIAELEGRIADLEGKLAELAAKVGAFASAPAAAPAHEQFKQGASAPSARTEKEENLFRVIFAK